MRSVENGRVGGGAGRSVEKGRVGGGRGGVVCGEGTVLGGDWQLGWWVGGRVLSLSREFQ